MKPAIVVVGSLNMDFVVRTQHLPAVGETVLGHGFRMLPGGKGANQACAAGRLSAGQLQVRMIGRVGQDLFADHLKASLAAAGVDVSFVHTSKANPTGVAFISVSAEGQNQIVVASGANMDLHAADMEATRRVFAGARFALFQLETPLGAVTAAMRLAREEQVQTILDPAPAQALPAELLGSVDILTPNEGEALGLLGRPVTRCSPRDAQGLARELRARGPRTVIVKLGDQGCFVSTPELEQHFPGFAVDAVDTTAAGDTFNAGLAIALAEERPLAEAVRFANAAAAIAVTRLGAQASAPARSEVESFLAAR